MRKLIAALLIAASLLCLCAGALADAPTSYDYSDYGMMLPSVPAIQGPDEFGNWTGEVIARQITMFSKASSSSSSLRKLKNGTQFDILDISGDYAHVSVPNEYGGADVGYVMFSYIIENPMHIVLRSNKGVYPMAGPYAPNKRVGTIDNYQRFTVIAETTNFYVVSFRDAIAFLPISADYWIEEMLASTLEGPFTNATVAYDKTKVYGYASTQYGKIAEFSAGTPVQVYYTSNNFAAIRYDNVLAFIQLSDLIF